MTEHFCEDSSSKLWILDGGTGREIEALGGPFRQPEWSALSLYEDPNIVQKVHCNFINSGCDAITTNSYAVVPFHLGHDRYNTDQNWLLKLSVDIAHQAVIEQQQQQGGGGGGGGEPGESATTMNEKKKKRTVVLGTIPPLCGSYEPEKFDPLVAGPILQDFLNAYTSGTVTGQPKPAVDILLLETIGSIAEARFYLENIVEHYSSSSTDSQQKQQQRAIPVWLSFCIKSDYGFDRPPTLLNNNETLTDAMDELSEDGLLYRANVDVVMVNCCDVRIVQPALIELKSTLESTLSKPAMTTTGNKATRTIRLGAYPNAFSIPPPDAANHTLRQVDYNINPTVFKNYSKEWIKAGASVLGGCCGIGPIHIAALRELANEM